MEHFLSSSLKRDKPGLVCPGCPAAEDLSEKLLRLPFYNDLAELDQAEVVRTVMEMPL